MWETRYRDLVLQPLLPLIVANPLQYSCLENPRDHGAWWAAVYGVAQNRTRLKQLSSSSSSWAFILIWPFMMDLSSFSRCLFALPFILHQWTVSAPGAGTVSALFSRASSAPRTARGTFWLSERDADRVDAHRSSDGSSLPRIPQKSGHRHIHLIQRLTPV